jgi:glycogen phosphorylase
MTALSHLRARCKLEHDGRYKHASECSRISKQDITSISLISQYHRESQTLRLDHSPFVLHSIQSMIGLLRSGEAGALYDLLERDVIPEFHTRDESGIPTARVARIWERMARLTPRYFANRAVREYTEQHYLPAAAAYRERAANKGVVGRQVVDWRHTVDRASGSLRFDDLRVETNADHHVFEVEILLNDLDPNAGRVVIYADGSGAPVRQDMTRLRSGEEAARRYVYGAQVPATRPPTDYTARVIPHFSGVAVPLKASQILWQCRL